MLTKIRSIESLKQSFITAVRGNTDKVTKVLATTVVNAFAYGFAVIAQRINLDIAYLEAKLFPEYAIGTVLDDIANREGIPARLTQSNSTVVIYFNGTVGTIYAPGTQVSGTANIIFATDEEVIIGSTGIAYTTATSTLTGKRTLVPPYSIDKIVGVTPPGHTSVTNTSASVGGQDNENDYEYRSRILNITSILSQNTNEFYLELIRFIEPDTLRIILKPNNSSNQTFKIYLVKRDATNFTANQLLSIKTNILKYMPIRDANIFSVDVLNIEWSYIDVFGKVYLDNSKTLIEISKDWNQKLNDYLDYKEWTIGAKVDFETIQSICRNTDGLKDLDDKTFRPRTDVSVGNFSLPRIRSIQVYDAQTNNVLNTLYPIKRDYTKHKTVQQIITQQSNL